MALSSVDNKHYNFCVSVISWSFVSCIISGFILQNMGLFIFCLLYFNLVSIVVVLFFFYFIWSGQFVQWIKLITSSSTFCTWCWLSCYKLDKYGRQRWIRVMGDVGCGSILKMRRDTVPAMLAVGMQHFYFLSLVSPFFGLIFWLIRQPHVTSLLAFTNSFPSTLFLFCHPPPVHLCVWRHEAMKP